MATDTEPRFRGFEEHWLVLISSSLLNAGEKQAATQPIQVTRTHTKSSYSEVNCFNFISSLNLPRSVKVF